MKDKRDECGCHKGCVTLKHECEKPCAWPSCLSPEEIARLELEIALDSFGPILYGPAIKCTACGYEALSSELFELHELSPGEWKWFCITDTMVLELNAGK